VVAVIGRHVELKRSGRTWKGCCPFHGERTPSFHVYPEDRHFKCYGCGEYGDVFKFLQKLQGKEFPEVVRALAAEVGVEIPERAEDSAELRRKRQERAEVLAALDAAARYFSARLWSRHGEDARRYLAERGLADETTRRFRIGVASTAWQDLVARLADKGVKRDALVKSGLVAEREAGEPYDRFRGRLLFPIAGLDGEVIGFGGRVMPGAPGAEKLAKYINSPESPVYKKSRVLYGIDVAREAIRRTRQAILVEGYFDVVGLHQAGVRNAVAVCGTALTPEHVDVLKRCDCREIVVLFDGDAAGAAAPGRAAQALLPAGIAGKVAILPAAAGKSDPDEFARANGGAAVEALVAAARPLTEHLIDGAVARHCGGEPAQASVEAKLAAFRELKPFVTLVPDGLARTTFEQRVAARLDVDLAALVAEVERPSDAPRARRATAAAPAPPARPAHPAPPRPPRRDGRAMHLWGPAVDALGLLASFPALAAVAEEENLVGVLPAGRLADLARDLLAERIAAAELPGRLDGALDPASRRRIEGLLGPARPPAERAERELRRAIVMARIAQLDAEYAALNAAVAARGSPVPEDLRTDALRTLRRLGDLKDRLRSL
jgi:DNA primase